MDLYWWEPIFYVVYLLSDDGSFEKKIESNHSSLLQLSEVERIQARALRLRSKPDWIRFIGSCYSLTCMNEKDDWTSISGQKYLFLDWMSGF